MIRHRRFDENMRARGVNEQIVMNMEKIRESIVLKIIGLFQLSFFFFPPLKAYGTRFLKNDIKFTERFCSRVLTFYVTKTYDIFLFGYISTVIFDSLALKNNKKWYTVFFYF